MRWQKLFHRSIPLFLLIAAVPLARPAPAASDAVAVIRQLDAALVAAGARQLDFFAPKHFGEASRLYRQAEDELKRRLETQAVADAQLALTAIAEAGAAAQEARQILKDGLEARTLALELDPSMASRAEGAERILREAAAAAEAGDPQTAQQTAQRAAEGYLAAASQYMREVRIPAIQEQLSQLRDKVPALSYEQAQAQIARVAATLTSSPINRLAETINELGAIIHNLFPPFFWDIQKIQLDDFTLQVISFDMKEWDFKNGVIINAAGTAWLTFQCRPILFIPFGSVATAEKQLRVVQGVRNPAEEISLDDAERIDPSIGVGGTLNLQIPAFAVTAAQVAQAVHDVVQWHLKPPGAIVVHFDNLVIRPSASPDTGVATAGTATYPTTPPDPQTATLAIAGFTLYLHAITVSPNGAVVEAQLEMPVSIVDAGTGHPGRIDLGTFGITHSCVFRRDLPSLAYGPWAVGNTEMQVQGVGVTADFDQSWAAPSAPPGSPAALPAWRGILLGQGASAAAAGNIISNSGYLRAQYSYPIAQVSSSGLTAEFTLSAPYEFDLLEPIGYRMRISTGHVEIADSTVASGEFDQDQMVLPERAVLTSAGAPVQATHGQLSLDANLDLEGPASIAAAIRWGEFTQHGPADSFYEAQGFSFARVYFAGTNRSNYFPVDANDQFVEPNGLLQPLSTTGMQGLTVFFPRFLQVNTPDTPGKDPLRFLSTNTSNRATADWLNFSFGGVHGRLQNYLSQPSSKTDLGPTYQPFYVGVKPFVAGLASGANVKLEKRYSLTMRLVSSAVYDSNMEGAFSIPPPVGSNLDFDSMAFTSVAQISGAKAPFNNPLNLAYWGLDMVKKPGATSGGIISVRTGQVFFTAVGIREPRHFALPFYLTWGEMLADGQLRRLDFDHNSAGQKFDNFHYVPDFVKLSDYDPNQPQLPAYLKTAGSVSLDFFGAKYINLNDTYDTTRPGDPFDNRVVQLMNDSDPGNAFHATDHTLAADWSSGFGALNFNYDYDAAAQDGFVGTGTMGFQWIDQGLTSSIVIKSDRTCMSANDTNRHDFTLGPVAHFGAMSRITGCGCIIASQLERVLLSAELEATSDANIVVRSASYGEVEWQLTPGTSSVGVQGDMYLSILVGGNLEVLGAANFVVNRDQDFVEGDVDGHFDTSSALGLSSLSGDGHLNWHVGTLANEGYEALQGQIAVSVDTPMAGGASEGGFYVGLNAPKAEAWVLTAGGDRYHLNTAALPDRMTGLFGYVKLSAALNLYIVSGGYEQYVGLGGFELTPQQAIDLHAQSTANVVGLPYVVGDVDAHVWGDILGGLVSADGWADLQVILPYPFSFQGTLGLEGCALWVACKTVDVTVGLNSSQGFYLE
jgi:hypothetical protein